ncbi:MAG: hypothetical protein J6Q73_08090 [Bacteroidaceae bacterium]|nr:hypothetical protein [Bacteroidaceae bacterium]
MKLGDWINRKRHYRGYGIQSPSSFFFVTQVLRERLPYYAYPTLDKIAGGNHRNKEHFRELFRITNHYKPANCISVGSATAACTMALARPSVTHYALAPAGMTADMQTLLNGNGCHIADSAEQLTAIFDKVGEVGMLFINATEDAHALIRATLPYINKNSIIVVDGINRNKTTQTLWQQVVNDSTTIITYDMYSYGVLLFDKERIKQHYTLKR